MESNDENIVLTVTADDGQDVDDVKTEPAARASEPARRERDVEAEEVPPFVPEPKLDATDAEGRPLFATYEDWTRATARWTLYEDRRQQAAARAQAKMAERHNAAAEEFKKLHAPDFDAVLEKASDAVRSLQEELGPNAFNIVDGYTTVDAENPAALVYHLAQHPEEMKRIVQLHPRQQVAALAKLDAGLSAKQPRSAGGRHAGAAVIPDASSDGESYQEYKARREREERAGRR